MDRRGFLRLAGVGGALIAAAPTLIVPPVRNALAQPERRIFLPPKGGWKIGAICEETGRHIGCKHDDYWASLVPGTDIAYVDGYKYGPTECVIGPPQWTLDIDRYWDVNEPSLSEAAWHQSMQIGGAEGWLQSCDISMVDCRAHERYTGIGKPPDLTELGNVRAKLTMKYPCDPMVTWVARSSPTAWSV